MNKTLRNILVLPVAICIRLPLMYALWFIASLGRWADNLFDWVDSTIPGLKR